MWSVYQVGIAYYEITSQWYTANKTLLLKTDFIYLFPEATPLKDWNEMLISWNSFLIKLELLALPNDTIRRIKYKGLQVTVSTYSSNLRSMLKIQFCLRGTFRTAMVLKIQILWDVTPYRLVTTVTDVPKDRRTCIVWVRQSSLSS
jgi:hypothetical protein